MYTFLFEATFVAASFVGLQLPEFFISHISQTCLCVGPLKEETSKKKGNLSIMNLMK